MKNTMWVVLVLFLLSSIQMVLAQDKETAISKIEELQSRKLKITNAERLALKFKVELINKQFERGLITQEVADQQKKEAAELHAANIDDRISILDKNIALLQRNNGLLVEEVSDSSSRFEIGLGHKNNNGERIFGIMHKRQKPKPFKYDKRTSSDLVISGGLNTVLSKGVSPISVYDQEGFYFELGWNWRYRLNKENNNFRLNYGVVLQHNLLKFSPPLFDFTETGGSAVIVDDIEYPQTKENTLITRNRTTYSNIVLPFHIETGPSKVRKTSSSIRYSLKSKFRFGLGGYIGINLGLTQKQSYTVNYGDPLNSFNEGSSTMGLENNVFVAGLSGYIGGGGLLFYSKYDLTSVFEFEGKEYRNFSIGVRLDL